MHLGIDIGGTTAKFGVYNENFELQHRENFSIASIHTLPQFFIKLRSKLADLEVEYKLKSIGVGFPSVIRKDGWVYTAPNIPYFENFNLIEEISKITTLPFDVDNDANVAAIAESEAGEAVFIDDFIYITLGTGTGGAIFCEGHILKGKNGGAGEIGHLVIDKNQNNTKESRTFRQGILENFTSRAAIMKLYKEKSQQNSQIDVSDISALAEKGDVIAIEVLQSVAEALAVGMASAANLLDINYFVIGGGISNVCDVFYDTLNNHLARRLLPSLLNSYSIHKAKHLADAGILGAAIIGRNKLINTKNK